MKKQLLWLLFFGTICMSITVLTRSFFQTPESISDFLKGFGIVFVGYAAIKMSRIKKGTCAN